MDLHAYNPAKSTRFLCIDSCGTVLSVSGQGGKLPDRCDRKPQKMYYVVKTIVPL